jgi:uncharacterized protein
MSSRACRNLAALSTALLSLLAGCSDQKPMLSVVSGGTGGVYYPLGGGLANLLTERLDGFQVTAEVTGGSVDNLRLVGSGRADIGFSMVDAAWDAYKGADRFADGALPVRTLAVLYPNRMQVVTVESSGIAAMADLRGRRVSIGSAGSATELMALRVLETYDLQDAVTRERLSVAESVNAMRDRKIDAFFWAGGVPTAAVTDLAASPGTRLRLIDHADAVEKMNARYGPLYSASSIAKDAYPGMQRENANVTVWNILFVSPDMPEELAYRIVQSLFENKQALVNVHKEAGHIALENQSKRLSPIPFHPGAARYFAEKGVKVE